MVGGRANRGKSVVIMAANHAKASPAMRTVVTSHAEARGVVTSYAKTPRFSLSIARNGTSACL